jgi:superfamily II DNA or RNA helicase
VTRLEDLHPNSAVRGILPDGLVTVVNVQWYGDNALELTYKDPAGRVNNEVLYRSDESRLHLAKKGKPWSFDGDGKLFRLVAEAHRIAWRTCSIRCSPSIPLSLEPLPHQITAVYEEMLPRQPLRFLLADDPGAGKTIMAGLLMKEMMARGDLQRCLVVCPGSLAEQWQDELYRRFHLKFDILTNDKLEASLTGNWFRDTNVAIARLDKLSRNEDVQAKLLAPDCQWNLVVCDEAHKLSATFFGGEVKYTKRYKLGQLLSGITRHFLLMTATPHNGKEEDFQLFMALLDGDRFEGKFRDGVHVTDASDLMRRMVKEKLLKFDGTPLFPPRLATTVPYKLSDAEARLYKAVTEYVRQEWRKADDLKNDKRANTVGFALTMLQRRLASSPEAIYQSLRRRRERLEKKLREVELMYRAALLAGPSPDVPELDADDIDDLEEAADDEMEQIEEEVLDQATAARTAEELRAEIASLVLLERTANDVRRSGDDRKWVELSGLLHEVFAQSAMTEKLVIFTEHRDTLSYLQDRISRVLGSANGVQVIHGSIGREDRMKAQEAFKHDPSVRFSFDLCEMTTDMRNDPRTVRASVIVPSRGTTWGTSAGSEGSSSNLQNVATNARGCSGGVYSS